MSGGSLLEWLGDASLDQVAKYLERFDKAEIAEWPFDWQTWARLNQLPPQGDWRIWLIMAGRGFGKTRLGAEWVRTDCAVGPEAFEFGWLRPVSGADCGLVFHVFAVSDGRLMLERPLASSVGIGDRLILREGCDHTIATCADRFANATNFQGEPNLPGNDLLTRYPAGQQ
jgi:hypothetical protein